MQAEPSLTVLSLGGGVQSSVMALMASQGAFDRVPDCAPSSPTPAGSRPASTSTSSGCQSSSASPSTSWTTGAASART